MFDRLITSTTVNDNYLPYWPYISKVWSSLFGCIPTLAFVSNDRSYIADLEQYGDIYHYIPSDLPVANQAKVARLHLASRFDNELCVINDIDLMPLQAEYFLSILKQYRKGCLLCVGSEVYNNTPDEGKFPMGYMTGNSSTFAELINYTDNFNDFVNRFVGMKVFDHKEDISITVPPGEPDTFSDESLVRVLLSTWDKSRIVKVERGYEPYWTKAICRANKNMLDITKLHEYVEYHLPHPFDKTETEWACSIALKT